VVQTTERPKVTRIIIKGSLFFVAINILFAWWNPPFEKYSIYNNFLPGQERFVYNNIRIFTLDAIFAPHIISTTPKSNDEYRIVMLGDSSTWGAGLTVNQTLTSQINQVHLTTCDSRKIKAYNLAYPVAAGAKDILILSESMQYKPDMVIWMTTMLTLTDHERQNHPIVNANLVQLGRLENQYSFVVPEFDERGFNTSFWDFTIIGQRTKLKNTIEQTLLQAATNSIDEPTFLAIKDTRPQNDLENDLSYEHMKVKKLDMSRMLFSLIKASDQMTGDIPLIVVNEPIYIANGQNSDKRYNQYYPRWAYDEYLHLAQEEIPSEDRIYLDLWNILPATEFTDTEFHRTAEGEKNIAQKLIPIILENSCKQY
jgi:hypothetical protein